jgi:uncharacterized protein (TIGR02246 family)
MPAPPARGNGYSLALLTIVSCIAFSTGWAALRPAWSAAGAVPQLPLQEPQPPAKTTPGAPAAPPLSAQAKEIRAFDELYVRDFNSANAKAVAARFTEDAEVIEADGLQYEGRTLIEERLAETFAASPGAKIAIEIESIRLLSPDAAKEEGRTIVTDAKGGPPAHRRYTALLVKRDGNWLLSSVREESDPTVSPHDRLQVLAWMLGDWIDEGEDSVIRVSCRWSEDGNYLMRNFTVRHEGKDVMTVTQRIGWDPVTRQIRSWEFDSQGGFGEGKWGGEGGRWVIKHTATRPDGTTISATNTMVRDGAHVVRWTSTDRFIGHEPIPDELAYAFVRVPAPPGGPANIPAAPAAPDQNQRSPR